MSIAPVEMPAAAWQSSSEGRKKAYKRKSAEVHCSCATRARTKKKYRPASSAKPTIQYMIVAKMHVDRKDAGSALTMTERTYAEGE